MFYPHEQKVSKPEPRFVSPMPSLNKFAQELMGIYIAKRGLSTEIALLNGWYGSVNAGDRYARVVIPAINTKGFPYWQARLIGNAVDEAPRYQSPFSHREDSLIIVNPLASTINVAIAEGPFDALALAELGYISIALMGNKPPISVWDHFESRYRGLKYGQIERHIVTLVADRDSVGETTLWQAQLGVRGYRSRVVIPEGGKDIASLDVEQRKKVLA